MLFDVQAGDCMCADGGGADTAAALLFADMADLRAGPADAGNGDCAADPVDQKGLLKKKKRVFPF